MNDHFEVIWGIDISKAWMDISIKGHVSRVKQSKTKINEFIKKQSVEANKTLIVLESTGGYELLAVNSFSKAGFQVHVAHPNKVRSYAKAKGYLAKSDQLDARILESYGSFIDSRDIRRLPTPLERSLSALSSRLSQLKETHHQEACRLGMTKEKTVCLSHQQLLRTLEKEINKIEQQLLSLISSDPQLSEKYKLLQSMKGVGSAVAMTILAELPELGQANEKEIAALVGVAPITKESGKQRGRAFTQNGRAAVRKLLYMAALSAIRFDQRFKKFYDTLLAKGKVKKVALVAVMRKMIVILNAMMKSKMPYKLIEAY